MEKDIILFLDNLSERCGSVEFNTNKQTVGTENDRRLHRFLIESTFTYNFYKLMHVVDIK